MLFVCIEIPLLQFPLVALPALATYRTLNERWIHCLQGDTCQYSHDDTIEPCKQLVLHGVCRFGPNCHFSHEPLPAYAVAPLQDWFKEQDQLKLDRSARSAEEARQLTPDPLHSPDDCAQATAQQSDTADIPQDACPTPDQSPSLVQANSAVPQ